MKDDDSKGTSVHKVTLKSHQNPIFAAGAPRAANLTPLFQKPRKTQQVDTESLYSCKPGDTKNMAQRVRHGNVLKRVGEGRGNVSC